MAAGGLQLVKALDPAHNAEVLAEHEEGQAGRVRLGEHPEHRQAAHQRREVKLVPCDQSIKPNMRSRVAVAKRR